MDWVLLELSSQRRIRTKKRLSAQLSPEELEGAVVTGPYRPEGLVVLLVVPLVELQPPQMQRLELGFGFSGLWMHWVQVVEELLAEAAAGRLVLKAAPGEREALPVLTCRRVCQTSQKDCIASHFM